MFATFLKAHHWLTPAGNATGGRRLRWFRTTAAGVADPSSLKDCVNFSRADPTRICPSPDFQSWLLWYSNGAAAAGCVIALDPDRYRGAILISGPLVS